jgi:hypothetical protein
MTELQVKRLLRRWGLAGPLAAALAALAYGEGGD